MSAPTQHNGKQSHPTNTWLAKMEASRENKEFHGSAGKLVLLCWQEGHGPVATARMADWFCSTHPAVIAQNAAEKAKKDEAGKQ